MPQEEPPSNKVMALLTTPPLDVDDGVFLGSPLPWDVGGGRGGGGLNMGRRSLFEDLDDIEDFEEDIWDGKGEGDLHLVNVLGYKMLAPCSLSGRKGTSLRISLVTIRLSEVEGTARAIITTALSSIQAAEDRRIITLRTLSLLVQEMLGIRPKLPVENESKLTEAYLNFSA